jgi:hypothetical protein
MTPAPRTTEGRLAEIERLRAAGVITNSDADDRRAAIIAEL